MVTKKNIFKNLDPLIPIIVIALTLFGTLNIYSVQFGGCMPTLSKFLESIVFKQLIWFGFAILLWITIFKMKIRLIFLTPYLLYACSIGLLLLAIVFGKSVSGHNAWVSILGVRLQPSEPAKITTALMIAEIISSNSKIKSSSILMRMQLLLVVCAPILLILMQGDAGSAIVFFSFAAVFFIENIFRDIILLGFYCVSIAILSLIVPKNYLLIFFVILFSLFFAIFYTKPRLVKVLLILSLATGSCIYGTSYVVNKILKPHQKNRISAWLEPNSDPLGIGWNTNQSKIAIGSGGFLGKGPFCGTQTRYGFVPEQHTDFIFCTVGEEYGFVGCFIFILFYTILILRIFYIADRQVLTFSRIYGYCIGVVLFAHFTINVGMTIGIVPTIGIPLPFMSYGGSALVSFFIMIGILLKLDKERASY